MRQVAVIAASRAAALIVVAGARLLKRLHRRGALEGAHAFKGAASWGRHREQ